MGRFILVSLGLLVVALSLSGTAADPDCPFDWSSYNGHCYKVFRKWKTWQDAEMSCGKEQEGSHLASIHSMAESKYVARLVSHHVSLINVWIGLSDPWKKPNLVWSDGSEFSYKSWKRGQPNPVWTQRCVELGSFSRYRTWNDQWCNLKNYFICKFQPQVEGSTS